MAVTSKLIIAYFAKPNGTPQTGLTPTIDIWEVDPVGADTQVVTGAALTEVAGGFYKYNFTSYDSTLKFAFKIDGGSTALGANRYAISINNSFAEDTAFANWIENLDSGDFTTAGMAGRKINDIYGGVPRFVFVDPASTNGEGWQHDPFNNFTDAADFAVANGINKIVVLGNIALDRAMVGYEFYGVGTPRLTMAGFNVNQSEFHDLELAGTMGGEIHAHNCNIADNFAGADGEFTNCGFLGDITLGTSSTAIFDKCYSGIGGLGRPTITINGGTNNLSIRSYSGGLTLLGSQVGDETTIEMSQGKVTLDATNTGGDISVRGVAQFTDNSTGATVDVSALLQPLTVSTILTNTNSILSDVAVIDAIVDILLKFAQNRTLVDPIAYTLTVFDDNGTTPLHVFDLKDFTGSPSVDTIAERVPQ